MLAWRIAPGAAGRGKLRRREFISVIGGFLASLPGPSRAQGLSKRISRIAYLGATGPSALDPQQVAQFKRGLVDNGLIEGRNVTIDYFWAEGRLDRLQSLAHELALHDFDVIVTAGGQAVHALMGARVKTQIVFAIYGDPVGDGVVESLAHPGKNLTGLSMANSHLESKRLELLKQAFAPLKRVLVLHDPSASSSAAVVADVQSGARALGIESMIFEATDPSRFDAIFVEAVDQGANGVAAMASAVLNFHHRHLCELAIQHRLPSIWEASGYVRDGGLLSYGPNFPDMYRQAGGYIAKILKGARASDLPIEQPVRFEFAVNLKTAKALDLALPAALITRADEVIE